MAIKLDFHDKKTKQRSLKMAPELKGARLLLKTPDGVDPMRV
jgi:hypothetical protein